MLNRIALHLGLLLLAVGTPASAQDLVPAGSINDALGGIKRVVLFADNPAISNFAKDYRDRFFRTAELVDEKQAAEKRFADSTVIVFGTAAHPWLRKHRDALPFRFQEDAVVIDGRQFQGKHLRVICALRNPDNPKHRAVVYAAAKDADVVNINAVFHGPTEWLVADGKQTLAAGSFRNVRLPLKDMVADLEELVAKIKSVHPATMKGVPPKLATAIGRARAELSAPLLREQYRLVLNRLLHSLGDAHSSVSPLGAVDVLDMPFTWLAEGMIVTADTGVLHKGDRLLRIGTHTDAGLLGLLRGVIPAENDHWVRHNAEQLLRDVDFLRTAGIAEKTPVPVTVDRAGNELKLAVPLVGKVGPGRNVPRVRFELDQGNDLGVFVVDSCINDDFYKKTLKEFFDGVRDKKIGRIAVDVRRNGGGNSMVVNEFLRHVDVEHFTACGALVRWSDDAKAKLTGVKKLAALVERYPQVRLANSRVQSPFGGQVFVLTSKATFSSGNWFALIPQDNKIAKVLGEPTGNAPSSYGDTLGFQLSHSGLSCTLSYKHWQRPDPKRDPADCVTPDVILTTTRRHVIEGIDPVLEHLRKARRAD